METVSYFSAGVSSAVATKLMIDEIDTIMYTHIDDHHPDNARFITVCETWFGKPIEVSQHLVLKSVEATCRHVSYIRSRQTGATCTLHLKRNVRKAFENNRKWTLRIVWGLDYNESDRCENIRRMMPFHEHVFPLVDQQITKADAHKILKASGIKRPAMYDLGYHNNNCIGCVKGGMGYWNRIRIDFPDVFRSRAVMERDIGFPIIKRDVWLDELDPSRGRHADPICEDCGLMCELMSIQKKVNPMTTPNKNIIRQLRDKAGLTQHEVAKRLTPQRGQTWISNLENESGGKPSAGSVFAVAIACGESVVLTSVGWQICVE